AAYASGRVSLRSACDSWVLWTVADASKQVVGGWGGIRTPGEREPTPVFKTGALNHSATHPARYFNKLIHHQTRTKHEQTPNWHPIGTGRRRSPCTSALGKRKFDRARCGRVHLVEEMGIRPQCHRRISVAKAAADLDHVDAGGDERGGVRMAQRMEHHLRQASRDAHILPAPCHVIG